MPFFPLQLSLWSALRLDPSLPLEVLVSGACGVRVPNICCLLFDWVCIDVDAVPSFFTLRYIDFVRLGFLGFLAVHV